jgi:hypothetical protein
MNALKKAEVGEEVEPKELKRSGSGVESERVRARRDGRCFARSAGVMSDSSASP